MKKKAILVMALIMLGNSTVNINSKEVSGEVEIPQYLMTNRVDTVLEQKAEKEELFKEDLEEYEKLVEETKDEKELQKLIDHGKGILGKNLDLSFETIKPAGEMIKKNESKYKTVKEERLKREEEERKRKEEERRKKEAERKKKEAAAAKAKQATSSNSYSSASSSAGSVVPSSGNHALVPNPTGHNLPKVLAQHVSGVRYATPDNPRWWGWVTAGETVINLNRNKQQFLPYVLHHEAAHIFDFYGGVWNGSGSTLGGRFSGSAEFRNIFAAEWAGTNMYGRQNPAEAFAEAVSWYYAGTILTGNDSSWNVTYPGSMAAQKPMTYNYIHNLLTNY